MSDTEFGRVVTLACWWCHRELKTVVLPPGEPIASSEPMVRLICRRCYAEHLDEFHGEARD